MYGSRFWTSTPSSGFKMILYYSVTFRAFQGNETIYVLWVGGFFAIFTIFLIKETNVFENNDNIHFVCQRMILSRYKRSDMICYIYFIFNVVTLFLSSAGLDFGRFERDFDLVLHLCNPLEFCSTLQVWNPLFSQAWFLLLRDYFVFGYCIFCIQFMW